MHGIHHNSNVHNNINNNNNNNNNNTIIQFLLHIHKRNLFLLPIPTEVAFNATILCPILQDSIVQ